jgi:predicted amidohydrolase
MASDLVRIALAQMDPHRLDNAGNLARIVQRIHDAATHGAKLVVLPECAVSGYVFGSVEEALPATETVPGPLSEAVVEACRADAVYAVVGLLERDGDTVYNSAIIAGPEGLIACYRKCHLPFLGIDRYVAKGASLPVIDVGFMRIGVLICYDLRFPEAARSMTIKGADLIIIPTNWPQGAESSPDFLTRARAWENRVYIAACNRVGVECGVGFIGRSQIIDPGAKLLAEASPHKEETIYADIDPLEARRKRLVIRPGEFEFDPVGHRRPELYAAVLNENQAY